jgi:pimeloyl-ACP methyl ester carboxylesterase
MADHITLKGNDGLTFHALSEGEGPLVLCLHGFPDYPGTFEAQMRALARAGFRAVAPWMRGYHPDTIAPDGCYQSAALARDALSLIDALGYETAVLYGHDWGTVAANLAAVLNPQKVSRLITSAVPYGSALTESFISSGDQQRRSWYMFFFQLPFAEAAVALDNYAFVRRLWEEWSPTWAFTDSDLAPVRDTFAADGVLPAALGYYRAVFNPALLKGRYAVDQARGAEAPHIVVPALHLHGGSDGCIGAELVNGMAGYYSAGLDLKVLPNLGHFLHREDPAWVSRLMLEFLAA